jgi:hypothetical protein
MKHEDTKNTKLSKDGYLCALRALSEQSERVLNSQVENV